MLRDWGVFELRGKHDEKYLLDNLEEWRPAGQVAADFAVGAQHALMWAYSVPTNRQFRSPNISGRAWRWSQCEHADDFQMTASPHLGSA